MLLKFRALGRAPEVLGRARSVATVGGGWE